MGQKIVVGPLNKGLRNDVTPFNIDNDSFPVLQNAYQWRGRVKRKRGTGFLGRLQRFIGTTDVTGGLIVTILPFPIPVGSVSFVIGTDIFTDPGGASPVALLTNGAGTGSLDRATGVLTITGSISLTPVFYFPTLPVMGLEDFVRTSNAFPGTIAFDTKYSYNINTVFPYSIYDVSYYKNPPTGTYPGYIRKAVSTPTTWNGQDYQQFWTVNFQGALWATNGINIPFNPTNIGMQFKPITGVVINAAGPPALATLTVVAHGLVQGDFVFINEVGGITGINFQTGYVVSADPQAANTVQVEFPNATLGGVYTSGGIAQYLTNRSDTTKDCLRWYDGDPTNGSIAAPAITGFNGWINFAPPLSNLSFSISELPPRQYYLVGARTIVPFKDRLLFFGAVVQASTGNAIYLQDTVVYSQNGTVYYTASFTGDPILSTTVFSPILVPVDQTATAPAYFEDVTGFGGSTQAGIDQPITTSNSNGDVIIVGFTTIEARLVYTGNDIIPFLFYIINSELGSSSTFSAINMDKGIISRGDRGFIITGQTETQRIDPEIPNEVFEMKLQNNGTERVTSLRDYENEWMYFTYPVNNVKYKFPSQTLQLNYRDNSWAIFRESYTHYGSFRKQTGFTWATVGTVYPTWSSWNAPWNSGQSTLLQPEVIAGNQQGFIVVRDDGTNEGNSLYINNFANSTASSPNHNLIDGDFIIISGAKGTVGAEVNNKIFSAQLATDNTFVLNPNISAGLTYLGGAVIKRMYIPFIQTKQFPVSWELARKTRIGPQQYLFTTTNASQIQLLIFLSQNADNAWNNSPIIPSSNVTNSSLIYSTVLYTCAESTNLGLTPANVNLQMPTAEFQYQIWHRMNTSLIGDTVQLGFTLSEEQMRSLDPSETSFDITGITQASSAVLTTTGRFSANQLIRITGVVGMTQVNDKNFSVLSSTPTSVTIEVDSTAFSAYVSGGTATAVSPINQFAEIEFHGMILDVSPSQVLS